MRVPGRLKEVRLGSLSVPALGQGTWGLGLDPARRAEEEQALRLGLELGLRVIDTAEVYGEGATESFVGEALRGVRDEAFLVSKIHPRNASRHGVRIACERSLRRLRTERIDLYLLHWREDLPLTDAVEGFERLVEAGTIGAWGVSNFDCGDLDDLLAQGGARCAANQVYYNLAARQPEFGLVPLMAERGIPGMAYSPLDQGRLAASPVLQELAGRLGASAMQIAVAWLLRRPDLVTIPKAGRPAHVAEIAGAAEIVLDDDALAFLDAGFPAPTAPVAIETR